MKIGVISDTHVRRATRDLPLDLLLRLDRVDLILHAGDLTRLDVLERLARIAPVRAVYGNCDGPDVYLALPRRLIVEVAGFRIGLIHGNGGTGGALATASAAFPPKLELPTDPALEPLESLIANDPGRGARQSSSGTTGENGVTGTLASVATGDPAEQPVDCVVFGHSHQALCERRGGRLLLNPGSPTEPRFGRRPSFGLLWLDEAAREARGEIVELGNG